MQQPSKRTRRRSTLGAVICLLACVGVSAEPIAVDPPIKMSVRPDGGDRVLGRLVSYDAEGFDLQPPRGEDVRVAWDQLEPSRVLWVHNRVLDDADARGWFELAAMLFAHEEGGASAEQALDKMLRADDSLGTLAQQLRDGEPAAWPEPQAVDAAPSESQAPEEQAEPEGDGAAHAHDEEAAPAGPQVVGDIQVQFWGELSPELMAKSVETLKAESEKAQEEMRHKLRLYEDDNFLLYSDLPPAEARQWAGLLDDMYKRLVETFDLPQGVNVFRGKCAIYVFAREQDYLRFCAQVLGFNATGTAGVCQGRGDGFAVVAFYRQANTLNFAHVLVHESVHAFVHRYRSHPHIPSWINEGLAEYIAYRLVDSRGFGESDWAKQSEYMQRRLRQLTSLGGMLDLPHIVGWQYPVAGEMCKFMIQQSPSRYRAFINAIKDGKDWHAALEEDYGITRDQLIAAFGQSVGARNLRS